MITTTIIPVQVQGGITLSQPDQMEDLTLKGLGLTEAMLEEFVRKDVGILFPPEEETLLIVGQQSRNQQGGRADLIAVDQEGNIVLIELKRDRDDIAARREPFEFQAIRYAANYALIRTSQDLVQKLFAPYVEKHRNEFNEAPEVTSSEVATRRLESFLADNKATQFNQRQRIALVAASYDEQTLSACAWLAKNGIDIRCLSMSIRKYGQQHFCAIEQTIPPPLLERFFVEVVGPSQPGVTKPTINGSGRSRRTLPGMPQIIEWGLIALGDVLCISDKSESDATVIDGRYVSYKGNKLTYNAWGQQVKGWSSINIYDWAVDKKTGKTLGALRNEKLQQLDQVPDDLAPQNDESVPANDISTVI